MLDYQAVAKKLRKNTADDFIAGFEGLGLTGGVADALSQAMLLSLKDDFPAFKVSELKKAINDRGNKASVILNTAKQKGVVQNYDRGCWRFADSAIKALSGNGSLPGQAGQAMDQPLQKVREYLLGAREGKERIEIDENFLVNALAELDCSEELFFQSLYELNEAARLITVTEDGRVTAIVFPDTVLKEAAAAAEIASVPPAEEVLHSEPQPSAMPPKEETAGSEQAEEKTAASSFDEAIMSGEPISKLIVLAQIEYARDLDAAKRRYDARVADALQEYGDQTASTAEIQAKRAELIGEIAKSRGEEILADIDAFKGAVEAKLKSIF